MKQMMGMLSEFAKNKEGAPAMRGATTEGASMHPGGTSVLRVFLPAQSAGMKICNPRPLHHTTLSTVPHSCGLPLNFLSYCTPHQGPATEHLRTASRRYLPQAQGTIVRLQHCSPHHEIPQAVMRRSSESHLVCRAKSAVCARNCFRICISPRMTKNQTAGAEASPSFESIGRTSTIPIQSPHNKNGGTSTASAVLLSVL